MATNPDAESCRLRVALEPQLAVAAQRYPQAVALLTAYDEARDNADNADEQVLVIIEQLRQLTKKPVSEADLFEYYEASSKEELAWQLSLPAPQLVEHIIEAEVTEIVRRLHEPKAFTQEYDILTFEKQMSLYYLDDYYHKLLKLHFPARYNYQYFGRRKGPDGRYYTLSTAEIVAKLLA
jgi:hypothetical protein